MFQSKKALLALAAGTILATAPANALTINLNDIGGVTGSKAELGFRIAADYWESVLTNDAVVNFDVGFSNLGPNVLGSTGSNLYTYLDISDYYALLTGNVNKSALDNLVLQNLAPLDANGSVSVTVPEYFNTATQSGVAASGSRQAPSGEAISNTIAVSTANLKALVDDSAFFESLFGDVTDAEINFSNTFAFDFNPANGVNTGTYDFIGVAVHEMGHALGFLSGAQDFDYSVGGGYPVDTYWWGYAADIFRYTADGKLDWTFNSPAYFSVDGGATAFNGAYWSTGDINGDGWQASHWKAPGTCNLADFEGIMNPYICDGLVDETTSSDLALLDAIGWNTNVDVIAQPGYTFTTAQMFTAFRPAAGVPEPSSWGLMLMGFGGLGTALRARRRQEAKLAMAA
jgi:hypothetical protein